jgi:hypothetical protein
MDREGAETYLRLLAEAELRRAVQVPAGGIPGRWHSARLALAAQTLTAVGAVGAGVADQIRADAGLAVAARHRLSARRPVPAGIRPVPRRASWRVVPAGQMIKVRVGGLRREVPVAAFVQSAGGARLIVAEWPAGPVTFTAADDRGFSYQVIWAGEMAPRELLLRPDPPHQIRWLDLTTAAGQPASRIDLDPQDPAPAPDVTATWHAHSPGELLLDVIAARILTAAVPLARDKPGQPAAADAHLRLRRRRARSRRCRAERGRRAAAGQRRPRPARRAVRPARHHRPRHHRAARRGAAAPVAEHADSPRPPAAAGARPAGRGRGGAPRAGRRHDRDHGPASRRARHHHAPAGHRRRAGGRLALRPGFRPMPVLWIRDSDGRWHATRLDGLSPWGNHGTNPWADTTMVTVWLRIIPPLDRGTAWIEISATGRSAQVQATLPVSPQ